MSKTAILGAAAVAALLAANPSGAETRLIESIPLATRVAQIEGVTEASRTVKLVWTTGAQVMRYDWYEGKRFLEELSLDQGAVDLSRLNDGAPLLASHDVYDLNSQLGVVERAWIEGGKGYAEVRFPVEGISEDADRVFKLVQDKIIRNVSVGYRVDKYQITDNQGDGLDVWRAVSWMPMELSLVTVPADAGAGVRSEKPMHACEFIGRSSPAPITHQTENEAMKPTETNTVDATRAAEQTAAVDAAVAAERTRCVEIRKRVTAADLPAEVAETAITRGIAVDHVGNFILDELAARGQKPGLPAALSGARLSQDQIEGRRGAIIEAVMHRADASANKLSDNSREFRGLNLIGLARAVLEADGVSCRGWTPMEIATRSLHTTSDFPNILAAISGKTLQAGYAAEQRTFLPFSTRNDAVDFKNKSSLQLGEGPSLDPVNEKGEFTRGTLGESAEAWKIKTYGKVIGITRQGLINDDLGAFTRIPKQFGSAGVRLENDIVWGIIIANAAMSDTVALCHATHANLITGGTSVLAIAGLSAMRQAFRQQKGLDKKQTLNLEMKILAVGSALETTAEQLISGLVVPNTPTSALPQFFRSLQPIVEPRLDALPATAWFGFTDPAQMESLEHGYLEGQEGVYLESRIGFDVDGIELKARHDFGAKAVNYRGICKSAGA